MDHDGASFLCQIEIQTVHYHSLTVAETDHLQCIYPQFLENIKKIYTKK